MLNIFDGTFLVLVVTREVAQHVFFIFEFILEKMEDGRYFFFSIKKIKDD